MIPIPFFPHIPRLIPEDGTKRLLRILAESSMWALLLFVIGANISLIQPSFLPRMRNAFPHISPQRPDGKPANILGAHQTQQSATSDSPEALSAEYSYWQAIVRTRPDYRDGYVRLASLAYQLGKLNDAKTFVSQIRRLDPNYPTLAQFEELLKE